MAVYASFGLRLAQGSYFDYLNLAFDFDPPYFLDYLTGSTSTGDFGVNYKHPLWMLFRPFGLVLLSLGFTAKQAAALVMALFGGLSVALAYGFARLTGAGRPESLAASLFFAGSCSTWLNAMVIESYGWANFSLALMWCGYALALGRRFESFWARALAAALVAGVTITNLVQALIAEGLWRRQSSSLFVTVRHLFLFGALVGLIVILLIALCQPRELWWLLSHPVSALKEVYWMRTKTDAEAGLLQLMQTFFVSSFFAPEFEPVPLSPVVTMLDFRGFSVSPMVLATSCVWCGFLLFNGLMGLRRSGPQRVLTLALLAAVAFNLLFHLDYQLRGSVFIYAAHLHFPIFALSLGAAPWVRQQGQAVRLGYAALFLLMAGVAWANNGLRNDQLIEHMTQIEVPADAPEVKPVQLRRH